jgi:two-component system, OmpR family, response regulator
VGLRKSRDEQWDGTDRRAAPTVLVVNDEPDACEMLVRLLRPQGFRTDGAHSPDEAMSVVADQLPRCVVLDMASGGIGSGLRTLDQIRTHDDRRISTARVVLTAASPRNRLFSFQSGADAFLVRPFHLDELVAHIRDVLERPNDERARHRRDQLARS